MISAQISFLINHSIHQNVKCKIEFVFSFSAEATSRLFQENNDLILEESSESIAQVISKIIREISEKIYEQNSLKDLFGVE